jgi:hydroxyacylglutathione hydrolase
MTLEIKTFPLGPLANNTYLLVDRQARQAVIVDPTFDSHHILESILKDGLTLTQIWLTHAHFDHTAGAKLFSELSQPPIPISLHPADLELYRTGGGASMFGIDMIDLPEPSFFFEHGQLLSVGTEQVEIRHTPGHSPGHVILYAPQASAALTGDLIFQNSVGRTDLPGGNGMHLLESIYHHILTLPPETRLLPGHGPETTVQDEVDNNPYLN